MGLETKLGENAIATQTGITGQLGPQIFGVAVDFRTGLLRDRNDGRRRALASDISRFGSEVFRASPRQPDLLIVSGRVSPEDGAGREAPV